MEGVAAAFIFGSWAARYRGESGPIPHDVDILVTGTADRDVLEHIADVAQGRLARPVNVRRISKTAWATEDGSDPFLAAVRERPLVELPIGEYKDMSE